MQSVQEFIESFLREKAETLRANQQTYQKIREKFFAKNKVEAHLKWREERDNNPECVSIIETTDNSTLFITSELINKRLWRHRYHVRLSGTNWEIHKEESECFLCKGTGKHSDKPCHICQGVGWKDYFQKPPD